MGIVGDLEPGTALTPHRCSVGSVHKLPITLSCTEGEGSQGEETPVGSGGGGEGVPQEH